MGHYHIYHKMSICSLHTFPQQKQFSPVTYYHFANENLSSFQQTVLNCSLLSTPPLDLFFKMYYSTSTLVYMYSSKELVSLLCKITEPKEMELFLTDLLTSSEQKELSQRLQIVKLLHKNVPQRTIAEKLGIGVATITRGSKEMQKKNSGFQKILDKYYDR